METPLARRAGDMMEGSNTGASARLGSSAPLHGTTTHRDGAPSFGARVVTTRRVSNGVPVVTTRLAPAADAPLVRQLSPDAGSARWEDVTSGAESHTRLAGYRTGLAKLLDALGEGLVLCDQIGRIIHSNRAAAKLLTDEMERARLHGEVRAVAQALSDRMNRKSRADAAPPAAADEVVEREFETARARFTLRATYLGAGILLGAGGAILVAVDRPAAAALSRNQLQTRYNLTSREVDVAIELAHGRSNAAIARALSISPHTARHHAEKIFLKLGVHSRAEVGRLVLGGVA